LFITKIKNKLYFRDEHPAAAKNIDITHYRILKGSHSVTASLKIPTSNEYCETSNVVVYNYDFLLFCLFSCEPTIVLYLKYYF